jgi:type III pantothenate kinase
MMITTLTLDCGNNHPHVGLFQDHLLTQVVPYHFFIQQRLWELPPFHQAPIIISHVGQPLSAVDLDAFGSRLLSFRSHFHDHQFFEMPVHYESTLGDDRLINAYAYFISKKKLQPHFKGLIIDAGTFLTMDVVDEHGFQGGFILPGIQTLLQSYQRGQKLPTLDKKDFTPLSSMELPQKTSEAIMFSVDGLLENFIAKCVCCYGPFTEIILTGGEANWINRYLEKLNPTGKTNLSPHYIHLSLHELYLKHHGDIIL